MSQQITLDAITSVLDVFNNRNISPTLAMAYAKTIEHNFFVDLSEFTDLVFGSDDFDEDDFDDSDEDDGSSLTFHSLEEAKEHLAAVIAYETIQRAKGER